MADEQLRPIVSLLVFLNFCMYTIVASIGGWAIHIGIDRAFIIGMIYLASVISIRVTCKLINRLDRDG